jgi:translation initiation factor IF-1
MKLNGHGLQRGSTKRSFRSSAAYRDQTSKITAKWEAESASAICCLREIIADRSGRAIMGNGLQRSGRTRMKEFDAFEMTGVVTDIDRGSVRVHLDNGHTVRATLGGRLMQHRIRVLAGDKVTVEMSPYDLTKGRIIWRSNNPATSSPAKPPRSEPDLQRVPPAQSQMFVTAPSPSSLFPILRDHGAQAHR